jgi:uncharacterized membrane protein
VLLIIMGVLACIILISILTCIYCCCCKTNKKKLRRRLQREEESSSRDRSEREARNAERKAERHSRYDEIRKKYGLSSNNSTPYTKFDNEA